jgi:tetratricopeptide (TPR) repeat protein
MSVKETYMREDPLLKQAIEAARAGRELTARDIFLEVVERDPRNEVAWMWLTGLLDSLDDCIYACEMVLDINPGNASARQYLSQLLAKKQTQLDIENKLTAEQTLRAGELLRTGKRGAALDLIRTITNPNVDTWRLLAEAAPETEERMRALEKVLTLVPADAKARQELERLRHFQEDLPDLAATYEEMGNFEKAMESYDLALTKAKSNKEWNDIYRKRARLENLRQENIAHISPALSIARMAGGPSLLYLSLLLVHNGLNPLANPEPLLLAGILWVMLGGGMIAFAAVRSHHRLWFMIFKDVSSSGTPTARFAVSITGWILVLLPHILLFKLALDRLFESDYMTFLYMMVNHAAP